MSSIQETTAAGEMCPGCDSLKQNVEFKTYYHEGGDTIVCEDCFNEMEGSEEEEEEDEEPEAKEPAKEPEAKEPAKEEEDCLADNPKCVKCKIHLSDDDMAVWTEDATKKPKCESCLDEEEEQGEEDEEEEEGQDCRGCGCWLPDGEECVFPESCKAYCDRCFEERQVEEEDDDSSSVHSTCCAECGESFKFDVSVPAADYHNNEHDQVCPPCMAKAEEPEAKEPAKEEPEDEEEGEEEEWCEEHEQVMWKNGLKCGGCLEGGEEKEMYGVLLQGDDVVFTENGKTVGTLKAVPCPEAFLRLYTALLSTDIDAFKKNRDILLKAQEFEEEYKAL